MASDEALAAAQDILAAKWSIPVLSVLAKGAARFSYIKAAIPAISANVLSMRLRSLEEAGLIGRTSLPPLADRKVYVLTTLGEGTRPILLAIERWAALLQASGHIEPRLSSQPTGRE